MNLYIKEIYSTKNKCKLSANKKGYKLNVCNLLNSSGPTWARTRDHLIMSQVL